MGLLNIFSKGTEPDQMVKLPSGSFTIDAEGNVITSTIPRSFPEAHLLEIAARVLETFQGARKADVPLNELVIQFATLKITARELRGGAIIFLAPRSAK